MKIAVLDGHALNPGDLSWDELKKLGEAAIYERTKPEEVTERLTDVDAAITNKVVISREVMEACPKLAYIGVTATGYNIIDMEAAEKRGIVVTNVPAYSTMSVAQMTFALLLELCLHVGKHSESVAAGEWSACPDFCYWNYPLIELDHKVMGIVGLGKIGQKVAKIAADFGMDVLYYSTHRHPDQENEHCHYAELADIWADSDVISLHCPLTPKTQGLINRDTIAQMKDGVMILNLARGPIVVEQDLADALRSGKVAGAAADVVSVEPIQADNPLLTAPNMILTPHIAWAPVESRKRLMQITVENLKGFMDGHPQNVVSE